VKGKAAVSVTSDKRRLWRPAESMAVVKPAEGAARCSNYSYDRKEKRRVWYVILYCLTYLLTGLLNHLLSYYELIYY